MARRLFAIGLVIASAGLARAEDVSPNLSCTTEGTFTNCDVVGDGSFETVVRRVQVLSNRPANDDAKIVDQLKRNRNVLPPPFLYELARRLFATDKTEAKYYFFLAGARARYDGFRCRDTTAVQGYQIVLMELGEQLTALNDYDDADVEYRALELLLERNEMFSGKASPWWICSHGIKAIGAAMHQQTLRSDDWLKPQKAWSEAEREVRDAVRYTIDKYKPK